MWTPPHSHTWAHGSDPVSKSRWGSMGWALGKEGFLSCAVTMVYSWWRWGQAAPAGAASRGEGEVGADGNPRYTFSALVTNGWRRLDLNTSTGDSRPPRPLRYLALGEWGAVFCLGVFPGHPPKSTDGPWCGNPI